MGSSAVVTGLVSGVLSGMFGIGGGLVTTPAIRLLLGYPALIAVGTPLLVIVPTAAAGAFSYVRSGLAAPKAGLAIGAWGAVAAVGGAALTRLVGGPVIMLITAAVVLYVAVDMLLRAWRRAGESLGPPVEARVPPDVVAIADAALLGSLTGLYSGLLGLGGGFVLVPLLERRLGMPIKRAVGTSLIAISMISVPGVAAHWYLGNIDPRLGLALTLGSVPGALVGARLARAASDAWIRVGFGVVLACAGIWLAANELVVLWR